MGLLQTFATAIKSVYSNVKSPEKSIGGIIKSMNTIVNSQEAFIEIQDGGKISRNLNVCTVIIQGLPTLTTSLQVCANEEAPDTLLGGEKTQESASIKADWLQQFRDFRDFEENIVIKYIKIAIHALDHRLNMLKGARSHFLGNGSLKPYTYLYARDVIQNFKIKKRFVVEWKDLHKHMNGSATADLDKGKLKEQLFEYELPDLEELGPFVINYLMLQKEANIPAKEIANGKIPNNESKIVLNSGDCYVIASFCVYDATKLPYAVEWFREAHSRIGDGSLLEEFRDNMYMDLAYTFSKTGNGKEVVDLFQELVKTRENSNFHMIDLMMYYRRILNGVPVDKNVDMKPANETSIAYPVWIPYGMTENLFQVCSGILRVDSSLAAKLKCRFTTKNCPLFILSPLKEEEMYLDPKVFFYHDFMTNSEINQILRTAYGRMQNSGVANVTQSRTYRSSKTYFFDSKAFDLDSLNKRSETLVGLYSETEEKSQVVYYDAGGYYNAHYDTYPEDFSHRYGNRFTTVLIYLNDVDSGGETAFYDLYVTVKPERGGALVWDSLRRSGLLHEWTGHGACPVIRGHKWKVLDPPLGGEKTQESASSKAAWLQKFRDFRDFEENILIKYVKLANYALDHRLNMLKGARSHFLGKGTLKPYPHLYASDVIQNFKINKRFVVEWKDLLNHVNGSTTTDLDKGKLKEQLHEYDVPDLEELRPFVINYLMLQKEAKIPAKEIANGKIPNNESKLVLNSGDCYAIASFCVYDAAKLPYALEWFREALSRISDGSLLEEFRYNMYSDLAYTFSKTGNGKEVVDLFKELVKTRENNNFHMIDLMMYYRRILNGVPVDKNVYMMPANETSISYPMDVPHGMTEHLFQVCAGILKVDASLAAKLKCRFTTKNSPLFILSPLKEEEVYLDPKVLFYHDFMTNSEINRVIKKAYGRMENSLVGDVTRSRTYRSSKTYFAHSKAFNLDSLDKRSETLVGLNSETEESSQVVYYDAGGFYNTHYDPFPHASMHRHGNRFTTVLIYLNDVDSGGETAFHDLYVAVKPERGGALVWDNLRRSGLVHEWTGHGACPVIRGHKWIVTKWYHYKGQMFHRPCALSEHE